MAKNSELIRMAKKAADAWRNDAAYWQAAQIIDMLVEELEKSTLTQPNEWVSVDEKLPKEKQRVIVRCERVGTSVGWILWGNWMTDIGPDAGKVTHWRPLPAPRAKEDQK